MREHETAKAATKYRHPTIAYVAPFLVFVSILELQGLTPVPPQIGYPLRAALTVAALCIFSSWFVRLRPSHPLTSVGIGLAVFAIWIAPDAIFPHWHERMFGGALLAGSGSMAPLLLHNPVFLTIRVASATLLVPIIEELFWRGWLMRWLLDRDFDAIPLGTYVPWAFWVTAALFATEHGPYWDVGLAAGVIYNWWMVRTRNLADCMLAHAVTNGALAAYVMLTGAWRFWL
jgi:CAAX prenyl protease-like protein